jgi:hypothetical protein
MFHCSQKHILIDNKIILIDYKMQHFNVPIKKTILVSNLENINLYFRGIPFYTPPSICAERYVIQEETRGENQMWENQMWENHI